MSTARSKGIIITCFLLVALVVIITKIRVSTDLALFLPEPVSKVERLLHHQLDNGASTNIIFFGFSGLPVEELAAFNQRITEKLRQSDTFRKVTNNAASLSDTGLEFLDSCGTSQYKQAVSSNTATLVVKYLLRWYGYVLFTISSVSVTMYV